MNPTLLARAILQRLSRHPAKAMAMGFGITIAVLATVVLQTAASQVRSKFLSFIDRAYPVDGIVLYAGSGPMGLGGVRGRNLRLAEVETIVHSLGIEHWDPVAFAGMRDVRAAGASVRVPILGYSEQAETVRRRSVARGEFFDQADVTARRRVALIGTTTAARLFGEASPLGETIFIEQSPFEVKGVLEQVGADPHGGDMDDVIHVPFSALLASVLRSDSLAGAMFLVDDSDRVAATSEEIRRLMREQHEIGDGQREDFTVVEPEFMRKMFARSFRTVEIFVPLLQGTSYGISVLIVVAVLQVSLRARTGEIGLRRAVGARRRDIEIQIVLEVLALGSAAAGLGLLLAPAVLRLLTPLLMSRMGVNPGGPDLAAAAWAVAAALITSVLGVLLPARRAANIQPARAVR